MEKINRATWLGWRIEYTAVKAWRSTQIAALRVPWCIMNLPLLNRAESLETLLEDAVERGRSVSADGELAIVVVRTHRDGPTAIA